MSLDATARADRLRVNVPLLAWRQTWRDLRAGELRLLFFATMLAVAALSAVGFFADRLQGALRRDASLWLGGDAVAAADRPVDAAIVQAATQRGLQTAVQASFPTMARATDAKGGGLRLVALKAVGSSYPLRGGIEIADGPPADDGMAPRRRRVAGGPARGQAWVEPALLSALGLQVGDALLLGQSTFLIGAVLMQEPDRGGGFVAFAPRVMIPLDDLAATALVQDASRVTWRLAVAQPPTMGRAAGRTAVDGWLADVKARVADGRARGVRLETLDAGQPALQQTMQRAERFLDLVALLTALLAAVAVALGARDFAWRRLDTAALWRVLGASQRSIAAAFALSFLGVALVASAAGLVGGLVLQQAFTMMLQGLVPEGLPAPGWAPAWLGLGLGVALVAGFGLPPVLQLAQTPPLRVLRRDLGAVRALSLGVWLAGLAALAMLLLGSVRELVLGSVAVAGFAAAALAFALAGWAAVAGGTRLLSRWRRPLWLVLGLRQLAAQRALTVVQIVALSLGLLAIVLLVLLRGDLVDAWRRATPKDAPDRFVINIQPDQGDAFRAALQSAGVQGYDWYPMIRGRLVAVNGQAMRSEAYADPRARQLAEREFNLSHARDLPVYNRVVQGRWVPEEANGVSVEEGIAQTLGLKLGDTLTFETGGVGGERHTSRITSLRKLDWGSMRVNFFVLFPHAAQQAALGDAPVTWIAAFRAPAGRAAALDRELTRRFPNLTIVDMAATIEQAQQVLQQVTRTVELLFIVALVAGLTVLFAALAATRDERRHALAVMRALGAGRSMLGRMQAAELVAIGALAGLLAAVAAMGIGALMAQRLFDFTWAPSPWTPIAAMAAGALLAWLAGTWSLRGVMRRPVLDSLRSA